MSTLEGRAAHLAAIDSLIGRLHERGQALLLTGEPGAGKTALLDVAHRRASSAGVQVLRASGVPFESAIPYSGLSQIAPLLAPALDDLEPGDRRVLRAALGRNQGSVPDLAAVATAASALLSEAGRARPLLLVLDDLQWLDRLSSGVFSFIARRSANMRTGVLAAVRAGGSSVLTGAGVTELDVGPLSAAAAARLLGDRCPWLSARQRERIILDARGNVLALLEFGSTYAATEGSHHASVPSNAVSVSRRVQDLFAARVGDLPPASRRVLLLMALSGSASLHDLRLAAGATVLTDLAPAERLDLVTVDDATRRVDFRHPLAGSAVVALSTAEERCSAHRALAEAAEGDTFRRALHLAAATVAPDEKVAEALDEAGRWCLHRGDANSALQALIRAAELSPDRDRRSRRLAEAAYLGADVTGDTRGALALLDESRSATAGTSLSMAAVLATSYALFNAECDVRAAHVLLSGALEEAGEDLDAENDALDSALHSLLMVCWTGGRADLWEAFTAALARLRPRPSRLLAICAGTFANPSADAIAQLRPLDAAWAALRDEQNPVTITRTAIACVYTDRLAGCRPALERVVSDGRTGGATALAINALTSLSVDDWQHGRWDRVQEQAAEGVRLSHEHGLHRYSWILGHYLAMLVSTARGDLERGRVAADELAEWAEAKGAGIAAVFARHLRCLAALSAGEFTAAYEQACEISPAGTLQPYVPHALWVALDLVEAAVRSGRAAEAEAHVRALERHGIESVSTRLALVVRTARALVADRDGYRQLFEEAIYDPQAPQWTFDHARAQLLYGERLRRARSVRLSREHLAAAARAFAALGATPWAERAERELRATGLHHTGDHLVMSPTVLTAQELRVAQLAAEGKTNKEIGRQLYMSPRTVGAHLYSLFPRLGINSRAALRDALTALGHDSGASS